LADLLNKSSALNSRMATVNAVLYHKLDGFFFVVFYLLNVGLLYVGPVLNPGNLSLSMMFMLFPDILPVIQDQNPKL
jgi:putative methionine-R-sulfoxide reductase with GAF domain